MTETTGWHTFDQGNPQNGLFWLQVERPETWCDAGDDGRTVGGHTGEFRRLVVLAEVTLCDDGEVLFETVGYAEHGQVQDDDRVTHCMALVAPEIAA